MGTAASTKGRGSARIGVQDDDLGRVGGGGGGGAAVGVGEGPGHMKTRDGRGGGDAVASTAARPSTQATPAPSQKLRGARGRRARAREATVQTFVLPRRDSESGSGEPEVEVEEDVRYPAKHDPRRRAVAGAVVASGLPVQSGGSQHPGTTRGVSVSTRNSRGLAGSQVAATQRIRTPLGGARYPVLPT